MEKVPARPWEPTTKTEVATMNLEQGEDTKAEEGKRKGT